MDCKDCSVELKTPREEQQKRCKGCAKMYRRQIYLNHPEYKVKAKLHKRMTRRAQIPLNELNSFLGRHKRFNLLKIKVLKHYGGKCEICKTKDLDILTIDHLNNNGAEHRKQYRKGMRIYQIIEKENYPPEFQILCFNCNIKKERNRGRSVIKSRCQQMRRNEKVTKHPIKI